MICSVQTLGFTGIQGSVVTAECYISGGLPGGRLPFTGGRQRMNEGKCGA